MAQSILEESKKAKSGFFGKLIRNKVLLLILIVVAVGTSSYYYYTKQNNAQTAVIAQTKAVVKREDLKISIESSGKVVAKDGVELSFPVTGNLEVSDVFVKEGDKIKKGDKVASVKTESLEFELRSAYNNYQSALSSYNTKREAATDSEKNKSKAAIDQAQVSLDQAKISLEQTKSTSAQNITNAETNVTTAESNLKLNSTINDSEIVHNAYLSLINTLKSINVSLVKQLRDSDAIIGVDDININKDFIVGLGVMGASSLNNAKDTYSKAKSLVNESDLTINSLNSSSSNNDIDKAAANESKVVLAMQEHLRSMKIMLDQTIIFSGLTQSKLDSFKSTVNSNQSSAISMANNINSATQAVDNAKSSLSQYQTAYTKALNDLATTKKQTEQNINNATISVKAREISLTQAKSDYADLIAPVKESDLSSVRSSLTSAAISVDKAKYNMEQATLTSPIEGIVSQLNYKKGDIILSDSSTKSMATIINTDTLYIEVNIEEADISKLKVGQKAKATFDAVEGLTLEGDVTFISLTSNTSSNGIVTYLVRVALAKASESQIREGMTATVEFITSEATNVLSAPVAAVRNIGGKPSVEKADGTIVNVTTGFTDGKKVEIISGLNEGDVVVY